MKAVFLGFSLFLSVNFAHADLRDLKPQPYLTEGTYTSANAKLVNPQIKRWADDYIITGHLLYGTYYLPFQVPLKTDFEKDHKFTGRGYFEQAWTGAYGAYTCRYSMDVEIHSYFDSQFNEQLFIRSMTPDKMWMSWDKPECPPIGGKYVWNTDPNPYSLKK